ncbi:A/G-specific DNA-adenine glycosylase [Turneriella parva]|uniref:A/G-specific DNA-adenine glycosylase n=1 Tax=Turneriella parva (strain ATCC BAA-1111 / DSM 21527 / NCTC 11395 / H) TaxID=869212 RepID=I4B7R8_TURPD|nr:A/G-specific DNA-adenine glycosylase [Turneriella parva]AFM13325.1 A/G-specific DNA-adenine glycosylase [Turneriella parva DSM 21527]
MKPLLDRLGKWYEKEKHAYEFRKNRTPYRTWITEIFLQQTQIAAGKDKLKFFLKRFPGVTELARGPESDVLAAFRGMGYYSRARNMFKAAGYIAANHQGIMPVAYAELLKVPGIGHYTAAIIASIHNNEAILANDANHARVLSRLYELPHEASTPAFRDAAARAAAPLFAGKMPAGDVNEALMQWGQTICKKRPRCELCFAVDLCAAHKSGNVTAYPVKKEREQALDVLWIMQVHRKGDKYQVVASGRNFPFLRGELLFPGFLALPPEMQERSSPEKMSAATRQKLMRLAHPLPVDFRHAITRYRIAVKLIYVKEGVAGGEYLTLSSLAARCHSSLMQKALRRLDKLEF